MPQPPVAGSQKPVLHAAPGHATVWPARHAPLPSHVSLNVHGSPSLHAVPLPMLLRTHCWLTASHAPAAHAVPGQYVAPSPMHVPPPSQWSNGVQNCPSSQPTSALLGVVPHAFLASSQNPALHASETCPHVWGAPATHVPAPSHVSPCVQ